MIGDTSNYQHRGIAPRSLSHIFSEIGMRMETHFTITCTYMEIYNEVRTCQLLPSPPLVAPHSTLGNVHLRSLMAMIKRRHVEWLKMRRWLI
jgi:kinesin family protein 6/9